MQSLGPLWPKAALNVVINSEIPLNEVVEVISDFVGILIEQPLELAHFFVIIEVFLVLGVQLIENCVVVPKRLDQLFCTPLLGKS